MSQLYLQGLDVSDLRLLISDVLKEHTKMVPVLSPQNSFTEFLTRQEVAKRLKISLPTLHDYSKRGIIPVFRIGNKVRYKLSDIENSLIMVKSLKFKHNGTQK